jgi:two-component system, LytTR family, response regulator AlgR
MIPKLFILDDEAPARVRLKTLLSDIAGECPHELVGDASHPQAGLDAIAALRPDIVLLDVQMPGMSGIELAAHLIRSMPHAPAVIFISAYDEYALKAFDVHALDYLLKPVRATRLAEALKRAVALHASLRSQEQAIANASAMLKTPRQHFSVQERGRVLLVPVSEAIYLKAEMKYVTLRTRSEKYLIEASLTSLEEELAATFVRVHRNALVARDAIAGVEHAPVSDAEDDKEGWQVILRGIDERLPISRRQWAAIKALVK